MKTLKLKSVLFGLVAIMAISITLVSCEQDEPILLDPATALVENVETTSDDQRLFPPSNPCDGPYDILPNVNNSTHCGYYWGTIWHNGKCYWCH